jgi:hypothetical protein
MVVPLNAVLIFGSVFGLFFFFFLFVREMSSRYASAIEEERRQED